MSCKARPLVKPDGGAADASSNAPLSSAARAGERTTNDPQNSLLSIGSHAADCLGNNLKEETASVVGTCTSCFQRLGQRGSHHICMNRGHSLPMMILPLASQALALSKAFRAVGRKPLIRVHTNAA